MENLKSEKINNEVEKHVKKTVSILSDGYTGYAKLKEVITNHHIVLEPNKRKAANIFP